MPGRRLPSILTIWPDVTAVLREWKAFIERLDSWSWGPGFHVDEGDGGRTVHYEATPAIFRAKVATGGLTARVSDTQDGSGNAVLYLRTSGANRAAGSTVVVYNPFNVVIPAATAIVVGREAGGGYLLIGSDCVV